MAENERYRYEILKTIYLTQSHLEKSKQMDLETVHERLSQTAIKEAMWQRTGGKGLRNNELLVQTFKELEDEKFVRITEGKQNAKLYFLTESGRAWIEAQLTQEAPRILCLVDANNVAYYPNLEHGFILIFSYIKGILDLK